MQSGSLLGAGWRFLMEVGVLVETGLMIYLMAKQQGIPDSAAKDSGEQLPTAVDQQLRIFSRGTPPIRGAERCDRDPPWPTEGDLGFWMDC